MRRRILSDVLQFLLDEERKVIAPERSSILSLLAPEEYEAL